MVHCIVRGQEHCIEVGHLGPQSEVLYSQLPVPASDSGSVIAPFNALSITRYKSFFFPETTWQCFSQVLSVKAMLLWVIGFITTHHNQPLVSLEVSILEN